ncbi:hypothetical protein RRG08_049477 [Elysia crispata]|uniref:Uncharacterized protein n=1 Tax=Elysia crispata TaxID=231223 RepID=A0AAE1DL08_9GAST|nr:hypothetical protein RRG08_049477 [Elysia crispata]
MAGREMQKRHSHPKLNKTLGRRTPEHEPISDGRVFKPTPYDSRKLKKASSNPRYSYSRRRVTPGYYSFRQMVMDRSKPAHGAPHVHGKESWRSMLVRHVLQRYRSYDAAVYIKSVWYEYRIITVSIYPGFTSVICQNTQLVCVIPYDMHAPTLMLFGCLILNLGFCQKSLIFLLESRRVRDDAPTCTSSIPFDVPYLQGRTSRHLHICNIRDSREYGRLNEALQLSDLTLYQNMGAGPGTGQVPDALTFTRVPDVLCGCSMLSFPFSNNYRCGAYMPRGQTSAR